MSNQTNPVIKEAELFRTGNYGPRGSYTEADLDVIAKRFELAGIPVPITTDHKEKGPAGGWVTKIWRKANKLWGRLELHPAFSELLVEKVFRNRSIELYRNPRSLKAVTFLGAAAPAVKGLQDIVFSESTDAEFDSFDLEDHSGDGNVMIEDVALGGKSVDVITFDEKRENGADYDCFQGETKRERGIDFPPRAFLSTPDLHSPSTWKLRVWEDLEKKVTRRQLGLAAAAFAPGGFRGRRVQLPSNQVRTIKRRLRALYRSLDVPDNDIPAQILKFSIKIDGKEFFEEHFALTFEGDQPDHWNLRLYSDPNRDPDPKLVGQAISYFSPGGFGANKNKVYPPDFSPGAGGASDTCTYLDAKGKIIAACEQIGKDPAWADWKDSDIFHDPAITFATLVASRPDIITSFKEEYTPQQEESNMPQDIQELQDEVKTLQDEKTEQEARFSAQSEELATTKTTLESTTAQFTEASGQLEEIQEKEAKAAFKTDLEARVASAKLPDKFSANLIEVFSDAENLDALDAQIEAYKGFAASPASPITDNSGDESETGTQDVVQRAHAYMKKNGGTLADAYIATERKTTTN